MQKLILAVLLVAACGDDTSSGGNAGNGGSGGSGASNPTGGNAPGGASQGGAPNGGGPVGGENPGGGGPGGMGSGYSCDAPSGAAPALQLTPIATIPGAVTQVKTAPGNPDRLFIAEQDGFVRVVENGVLLPTPFIDVTSLIRVNDEEGLLGLVFHPDYANNGRFFLHYSAAGLGDSTVMEFHVSADPAVAEPDPVQLALQHTTDFNSSHNGGAVEFGNDGYLYISLGDGGEDCDPGCDALNPANLLGKISRIDVDAAASATGYPAAPGNPGGAKYFHLGLRNPWRMSFDACTGDLYIGDVGQGITEEVDVATSAAGGLSFGWPIREGNQPTPVVGCGYDGSCVNPPANPTDPIFTYTHNDGCAVIGGTVYRGSVMLGLRGSYFFGDYCSGAIQFLQSAGGALVSGPVLTDLSISNLSAFGIDGHGELYAASTDGGVYRIDPI